MGEFAHRTVRACAIAAAGIAVATCATATHGLKPGAAQDPTPATGGQAAAGDDSLTMQFMEITPQLVIAEQQARKGRGMQDLSALMAPAEPYRIERGDVLSIVVWDHPELNGSATATPAAAPDASSGVVPSTGFTVDRDGQIQFPYAGVLHLAGLTRDEARKLLAHRLARYISKPNVTLQL